VETFGALGADAVDFHLEIGRRITESTVERRSTEYLLQGVSVAIQRYLLRGNYAASVLGTVDLESADSQKIDAVFLFLTIVFATVVYVGLHYFIVLRNYRSLYDIDPITFINSCFAVTLNDYLVHYRPNPLHSHDFDN